MELKNFAWSLWTPQFVIFLLVSLVVLIHCYWFSVVMVANLSCVGVEELPWEATKRASEAMKAGRPLRPRKSKEKVHSSLSCQRQRYYIIYYIKVFWYGLVVVESLVFFVPTKWFFLCLNSQKSHPFTNILWTYEDKKTWIQGVSHLIFIISLATKKDSFQQEKAYYYYIVVLL